VPGCYPATCPCSSTTTTGNEVWRSCFNPALGARIRVEHEDNANTQGRMAGRNMAGEAEAYTHLPFFILGPV
jgi:hypothetical protein